MKKRMLAMLLAVMLLAMTATPAMAAAPAIKETEYEGNGLVEVEFAARKVTYKSPKVVVKDSSGKALAARIVEKDSDDLTFKVTGLKANSAYTYTISGVRKGATGSYGKVSGRFKTPSDAPKIKKIKYDGKDKELEIEFATKVQFKNLKVTVADASGRKLTLKKIEKDSDELEVKVVGMKKGASYTVTVSGVRVKGVGSYVRVTGRFVA